MDFLLNGGIYETADFRQGTAIHIDKYCEKKDVLIEEFSDLFRGKSCTEQLHAAADYVEKNKDEAALDLCCFFSLIVFARRYFPERFEIPFGAHHAQIAELIMGGDRGRRMNILAPRGSAKSTLVAFLLPLHLIFFKSFYEYFYGFGEKFILFLSRASDLSEQRVADLRREIETHSAFDHLVGKKTWRVKQAETSNGVILVPKSTGSKIRGLLIDGNRPSLVIADDLDDMELLRNPVLIEKNIQWFSQDFLPLGQPQTNFIVIDTVKGERAISNWLFSLPGWDNHRISAIETPKQLTHPAAEEQWQEYRIRFTDLTLPEKERQAACDHYVDAHPEMFQGVSEIWHDHPDLNYRAVREFSFRYGLTACLMEYQNLLIDTALAIFDMERAVRFQIEAGVIKRSDNRHVPMERIVGAVCFLDWAGQKDLAENAYAAVVGMFFEAVGEGNIYGYVYNAWLDRGSRGYQFRGLLAMVEELEVLFAQAGCDVPIEVYCEDVIDRTGDLKPYFQEQFDLIAEEMDVEYPLSFLPRHREKMERISGLEAPVNNGHIAFARILPQPFEDQMARFPTAEHVDACDALQGAWEVKPTERPADREAYRRRAQRRVEDSRVLRI